MAHARAQVVDRIGIPGMVIDQKLDDVSLLAWEAGIQLAVWLRDHVDLRGKRVLELGSGTGGRGRWAGGGGGWQPRGRRVVCQRRVSHVLSLRE